MGNTAWLGTFPLPKEKHCFIKEKTDERRGGLKNNDLSLENNTII